METRIIIYGIIEMLKLRKYIIKMCYNSLFSLNFSDMFQESTTHINLYYIGAPVKYHIIIKLGLQTAQFRFIQQ